MAFHFEIRIDKTFILSYARPPLRRGRPTCQDKDHANVYIST